MWARINVYYLIKDYGKFYFTLVILLVFRIVSYIRYRYNTAAIGYVCTKWQFLRDFK